MRDTAGATCAARRTLARAVFGAYAVYQPSGAAEGLAAAGEDWFYEFIGDADLSETAGYFAIAVALGDEKFAEFAKREIYVRTAQWIRRRHGGRWNTVFCDGHVEGPSTRELFDLRRDDILQRWHRDNLPHREQAFPFWQ